MRLIPLIYLLLLSFASIGQDRESKTFPKIGEEVISQIDSAKGWLLNPDGEWISSNNKIPSNLSTQFLNQIDSEREGLGTDNFISYQLREITYKNKSYYALIKHYNFGFYEYEAIKEDWTPVTSHLIYVFEKSELKKLDNIKDGEINMVELDLITHQYNIYHDDENDAFNKLEKSIKIKDKKARPNRLILHIAPYKEKGIVQFQIYATNKHLGYYPEGIINPFQLPNVSIIPKKIYFKSKIFNHCYYETNYINFNNFLKIEY